MPSELLTVTATTCPVCDGDGEVALHDVHDHWFGVPGEWSFRSCSTCRSLWLDPRPHPDDLGRAYERYYTHGSERPDATGWRRALRMTPGHREDDAGDHGWLGSGPGRALDVGCGDGRTLAALTRSGWVADGIDPDPESVAACLQEGFDARVATIDDVDPDAAYDAAVAVHVVEHVEEPHRWLHAVRRRVRPGGRIHLVTPNALGWRAGVDGALWRGLEAPRHLQVFSADGLDRLARAAGLDSVRITTSPRGTNGMVRAARAAARTGSSPSRLTAVGDLVAGEVAQLDAVRRIRRDPLAGDELVLTARVPAT